MGNSPGAAAGKKGGKLMKNRHRVLSALFAAVGLGAASGSANALNEPPQVLIEAVFVEIGAGASFANGEIGIDWNDVFLDDIKKDFSTSRGFISAGLEFLGPPIGNANLMFGVRGQAFLTDEVFNIDLTNEGLAKANEVRLVGENGFSVMPHLGLSIPLAIKALEQSERVSLVSQPRLSFYVGATISDQRITLQIDNGLDIEEFSESKTIISPTIGTELVMTNVLVPDGGTIVLGGLNVGLKARAQATFPSGLPGLNDIPFVGAAFKQDRDVEFQTELVIFITPRLVQPQ